MKIIFDFPLSLCALIFLIIPMLGIAIMIKRNMRYGALMNEFNGRKINFARYLNKFDHVIASSIFTGIRSILTGNWKSE